MKTMEKLKNKIRKFGIIIVNEGIRQYFDSAPPPPREAKHIVNLSDYVKTLNPYDLGYYSNNRGPELPSDRFSECRVFTTRSDSLHIIPKGGICAEIGVAYGDFSQEILNIVQPEQLYLMDIYFKKSGGFFGGNIFTEQGVTHEQYVKNKFKDKPPVVIKKGYSWDIMETFPDNYFDYVYVDGDHTYDAVKRDIAVLKRKVKNGGIIGFNDYTYFFLTSAFECGVLRAVNEFLSEGEHNVIGYVLQSNKYDDLIVKFRK